MSTYSKSQISRTLLPAEQVRKFASLTKSPKDNDSSSEKKSPAFLRRYGRTYSPYGNLTPVDRKFGKTYSGRGNLKPTDSTPEHSAQSEPKKANNEPVGVGNAVGVQDLVKNAQSYALIKGSKESNVTCPQKVIVKNPVTKLEPGPGNQNIINLPTQNIKLRCDGSAKKMLVLNNNSSGSPVVTLYFVPNSGSTTSTISNNNGRDNPAGGGKASLKLLPTTVDKNSTGSGSVFVVDQAISGTSQAESNDLESLRKTTLPGSNLVDLVKSSTSQTVSKYTDSQRSSSLPGSNLVDLVKSSTSQTVSKYTDSQRSSSLPGSNLVDQVKSSTSQTVSKYTDSQRSSSLSGSNLVDQVKSSTSQTVSEYTDSQRSSSLPGSNLVDQVKSSTSQTVSKYTDSQRSSSLSGSNLVDQVKSSTSQTVSEYTDSQRSSSLPGSNLVDLVKSSTSQTVSKYTDSQRSSSLPGSNLVDQVKSSTSQRRSSLPVCESSHKDAKKNTVANEMIHLNMLDLQSKVCRLDSSNHLKQKDISVPICNKEKNDSFNLENSNLGISDDQKSTLNDKDNSHSNLSVKGKLKDNGFENGAAVENQKVKKKAAKEKQMVKKDAKLKAKTQTVSKYSDSQRITLPGSNLVVQVKSSTLQNESKYLDSQTSTMPGSNLVDPVKLKDNGFENGAAVKNKKLKKKAAKDKPVVKKDAKQKAKSVGTDSTCLVDLNISSLQGQDDKKKVKKSVKEKKISAPKKLSKKNKIVNSQKKGESSKLEKQKLSKKKGKPVDKTKNPTLPKLEKYVPIVPMEKEESVIEISEQIMYDSMPVLEDATKIMPLNCDVQTMPVLQELVKSGEEQSSLVDQDPARGTLPKSASMKHMARNTSSKMLISSLNDEQKPKTSKLVTKKLKEKINKNKATSLKSSIEKSQLSIDGDNQTMLELQELIKPEEDGGKNVQNSQSQKFCKISGKISPPSLQEKVALFTGKKASSMANMENTAEDKTIEFDTMKVINSVEGVKCEKLSKLSVKKPKEKTTVSKSPDKAATKNQKSSPDKEKCKLSKSSTDTVKKKRKLSNSSTDTDNKKCKLSTDTDKEKSQSLIDTNREKRKLSTGGETEKGKDSKLLTLGERQKSKSSKLSTEIETKNVKASKLSTEIETKNVKASKLSTEIETKNVKASKLSTEIETKNVKASKLSTEIETKNVKASKLSTEIETKNVKASKLSTEIETKNVKASKLSTEIETKNVKASKLSSEIETKNVKASKLSSEIETKNVKASKLSSEIETKNVKASKLSSEIETKNVKASKLSSEIETKNVKASKLSSEIEKDKVKSSKFSTRGETEKSNSSKLSTEGEKDKVISSELSIEGVKENAGSIKSEPRSLFTALELLKKPVDSLKSIVPKLKKPTENEVLSDPPNCKQENQIKPFSLLSSLPMLETKPIKEMFPLDTPKKKTTENITSSCQTSIQVNVSSANSSLTPNSDNKDTKKYISFQTISTNSTVVSHSICKNLTFTKSENAPVGHPQLQNAPLEQNKPHNVPVEQNKIQNVPSEQNKPHNAPVEQNKPHNAPVEQNKPHNAPVEQNKPHNAPVEQNKPHNAPPEHNKPHNVPPVEQNKPHNAPPEHNKPHNVLPVEHNKPHNVPPVEHNKPHNVPPVEHNKPHNVHPVEHNKPHNVPPVEHNKPRNVPPVEHNKPRNVPPVEHNKPRNVPPVEHNKPRNVPPVEHNKPRNVPPVEHNKPRNVPPVEHNKPHNVPPVEHNKPRNVHPVEHNKPCNVPVEQNKPRNVPVEQNKPRNVSVEQNKPRNVPVEQNKPRNVPVEQNKPRNVPVEQNKPRNVPVEQNKPRNVPVEQNKPRNVPVEQNKPRNVPVEQNKPHNASQLNSALSIILSPTPTVDPLNNDSANLSKSPSISVPGDATTSKTAEMDNKCPTPHLSPKRRGFNTKPKKCPGTKTKSVAVICRQCGKQIDGKSLPPNLSRQRQCKNCYQKSQLTSKIKRKLSKEQFLRTQKNLIPVRNGSRCEITPQRGQLVCSVCHRSFTHRHKLRLHKRWHVNKKPYRCRLCGKMFRQKAHFLGHKQLHTGKGPHKCRICQKGFLSLNNLSLHLSFHIPIRPYKCPECPCRFNKSRHLVDHQRKRGHLSPPAPQIKNLDNWQKSQNENNGICDSQKTCPPSVSCSGLRSSASDSAKALSIARQEKRQSRMRMLQRHLAGEDADPAPAPGINQVNKVVSIHNKESQKPLSTVAPKPAKNNQDPVQQVQSSLAAKPVSPSLPLIEPQMIKSENDHSASEGYMDLKVNQSFSLGIEDFQALGSAESMQKSLHNPNASDFGKIDPTTETATGDQQSVSDLPPPLLSPENISPTSSVTPGSGTLPLPPNTEEPPFLPKVLSFCSFGVDHKNSKTSTSTAPTLETVSTIGNSDKGAPVLVPQLCPDCEVGADPSAENAEKKRNVSKEKDAKELENLEKNDLTSDTFHEQERVIFLPTSDGHNSSAHSRSAHLVNWPQTIVQCSVEEQSNDANKSKESRNPSGQSLVTCTNKADNKTVEQTETNETVMKRKLSIKEEDSRICEQSNSNDKKMISLVSSKSSSSSPNEAKRQCPERENEHPMIKLTDIKQEPDIDGIDGVNNTTTDDSVSPSKNTSSDQDSMDSESQKPRKEPFGMSKRNLSRLPSEPVRQLPKRNYKKPQKYFCEDFDYSISFSSAKPKTSNPVSPVTTSVTVSSPSDAKSASTKAHEKNHSPQVNKSSENCSPNNKTNATNKTIDNANYNKNNNNNNNNDNNNKSNDINKKKNTTTTTTTTTTTNNNNDESCKKVLNFDSQSKESTQKSATSKNDEGLQRSKRKYDMTKRNLKKEMKEKEKLQSREGLNKSFLRLRFDLPESADEFEVQQQYHKKKLLKNATVKKHTVIPKMAKVRKSPQTSPRKSSESHYGLVKMAQADQKPFLSAVTTERKILPAPPKTRREEILENLITYSSVNFISNDEANNDNLSQKNSEELDIRTEPTQLSKLLGAPLAVLPSAATPTPHSLLPSPVTTITTSTTHCDTPTVTTIATLIPVASMHTTNHMPLPVTVLANPLPTVTKIESNQFFMGNLPAPLQDNTLVDQKPVLSQLLPLPNIETETERVEDKSPTKDFCPPLFQIKKEVVTSDDEAAYGGGAGKQSDGLSGLRITGVTGGVTTHDTIPMNSDAICSNSTLLKSQDDSLDPQDWSVTRRRPLRCILVQNEDGFGHSEFSFECCGLTFSQISELASHLDSSHK